MYRFEQIAFVVFLLVTPGLILAADDFKVVQYWNGVANKNKKVTMAVRTNAEIEECIWINLDADEEYSAGKKKNGVQVSLDKFEKSDKVKTLCKIVIDRVKEDDHSGEWLVELEGKCREKYTFRRNRAEFRTLEATDRTGRKKRDTDDKSSLPALISNIRPSISGSPQIQGLSGRSSTGVQFQKARKSSRQKKSNCKVDIEGIVLEVAEDDKELVLLAAMEGDALDDIFDLDGNWGVEENKKTILSTRTNQMPDECIVLFEGDEVVKVEKRAKKDKEECEKFEKANVCVSKHSDSKAGVYACQLSIDDMNEDLEGNWEVEVIAGREEGSVEFDVEIFESADGGDCEVEEDEPSLANVRGNEITVCTDDFEEGDEFTLEVEFESNPAPQKIEWEMRRENKKQKKVTVAAGKKKSGFDAEDEDEDYEIDNRYVAAITFDLEDEDWDKDENFLLSVKNKKGTSEFLITLDDGSRCKPTQEIGIGCEDNGGGNDVCDIEDKNCRCNKKESECCDASRKCEENCCRKCTKDEKDDGDCNLCDKNKRKCMISEDSSSGKLYECKIKDDKDCRCDDKGDGDKCCDASKKCTGTKCCKKCEKDDPDDVCNVCDNRGRKCMKLSSGINGPYAKALKVMLESCVKLGGTLLEQWTPEGDKRDSSKSERDFKNDLEDYFETAKCTRFDKDIQDYYEDGDKGKLRRGSLRVEDRTISDSSGSAISFQNTALRNKVAKVASRPQQTPKDSNLANILGFATKVVDLSRTSSATTSE